jgi:hypothetical protein
MKMIESIIQRVMDSTRPSSGSDLLGFEMDSVAYFGGNKAFLNAKVSRTGDPSCLLEMHGEIRKHIKSLQQIRSVLNKIWFDLEYRHFQATSCVWYKEATVLRFVTVISDNAFYVTGKMIVGGGHYSQLVEKYEREYGRKLDYLSSVV